MHSRCLRFIPRCLNRPQEKGVLSRISSGSFSFPALLTWRVYTKWKSRSQHCAPSSVKNTHKLNHLNLNEIPSGDMGEKKVDGNFSALLKKKNSKTKHPTELDARLCGYFQCHNLTTCSQDLSSTACYPLFANWLFTPFGVLNWISPQN